MKYAKTIVILIVLLFIIYSAMNTYLSIRKERVITACILPINSEKTEVFFVLPKGIYTAKIIDDIQHYNLIDHSGRIKVDINIDGRTLKMLDGEFHISEPSRVAIVITDDPTKGHETKQKFLLVKSVF